MDSRCTVIMVVALIACITIAFWFLPIEKILKDFIVWVKTDVGPWGPLVYALGYIPLTVLAVPASLLTLGGGYLFGLILGFITDSIGSAAGATAAFMVGRTIGRNFVASKLQDYPQFEAIALAIERQGFKIVLLLRMVPLLPFNMLNYLLAVTPISCYTYTLASWLGMMPMTLVLVYAGTTIKDITDFSRHDGKLTPARWIMLGSGLFTSVVIVIVVTRIAKDALQRAVEEDNAKVDEIVVVPAIVGAVNAVDPVAEIQQPLVVRIDSCDRESKKCTNAKPVGAVTT
ncbi:unnamed protein product [Calypogeia fissa]